MPSSGTCVVDDNAATNCLDNGGMSHMNPGEPDDYPDGGLVTPYFPYLSYTITGMWFKYTVEVLEAVTYSVGGLDGSPSLTLLRDLPLRAEGSDRSRKSWSRTGATWSTPAVAVA